jgi:hypothetical protein
MTLEGIVVNGVIVLDGTPRLPEGARVRVELTPDDPDDWENAPPPPSTESREELLAGLRESIAEAKAGVGGAEARTFLKELAAKHNLPLQPGE